MVYSSINGKSINLIIIQVGTAENTLGNKENDQDCTYQKQGNLSGH
jgi:hypothetical protein